MYLTKTMAATKETSLLLSLVPLCWPWGTKDTSWDIKNNTQLFLSDPWQMWNRPSSVSEFSLPLAGFFFLTVSQLTPKVFTVLQCQENKIIYFILKCHWFPVTSTPRAFGVCLDSIRKDKLHCNLNRQHIIQRIVHSNKGSNQQRAG